MLVIVFAVGFRFALPTRISIEHWDEAVYASNRFFADGSYPARYLYAPPLLPALIELAMLAAGPTSYAAVLPNLIFSTLTVALCWWAAREWFGRSAGLAAAALAAFNDFYLAYSRTALTDPALCFWFLLAVYFTWRAHAEPPGRGSRRRRRRRGGVGDQVQRLAHAGGRPFRLRGLGPVRSLQSPRVAVGLISRRHDLCCRLGHLEPGLAQPPERPIFGDRSESGGLLRRSSGAGPIPSSVRRRTCGFLKTGSRRPVWRRRSDCRCLFTAVSGFWDWPRFWAGGDPRRRECRFSWSGLIGTTLPVGSFLPRRPNGRGGPFTPSGGLACGGVVNRSLRGHPRLQALSAAGPPLADFRFFCAAAVCGTDLRTLGGPPEPGSQSWPIRPLGAGHPVDHRALGHSRVSRFAAQAGLVSSPRQRPRLIPAAN